MDERVEVEERVEMDERENMEERVEVEEREMNMKMRNNRGRGRKE
jgi:hypothetical protein